MKIKRLIYINLNIIFILLNALEISAQCASFTSCQTTINANSDPGLCTANVNVPSPTISNTCFGNQSLDFDGTNDYVSLPAGLTLGLDQFTFEAWVFWDGPANSWQRIMDFGSNSSINMFLTPRSGDGNLRFAITLNGTSGEQMLNAAGPLTIGQWVHVAVVLNKVTPTYTGTLYVNGVQAAQNTSMTLSPANLGNLANNWLGRSQYADPYFNGKLDEVRIWSTARTATEIQNNMNQVIDPTSSGLLAYYRFNQGVACCSNSGLSTLNDLAGTPQNGTLNNFSLNSGCGSNWVAGIPNLGDPVTLVNDMTGNCNNASGVYPVGTTTVIWTLNDGNGNTTTCVQDIVVTDNEPPIFTCQDITVSLNSAGTFTIPSANFIWNNIQTFYSDNCAAQSSTFGVTRSNWNCTNVGTNSTTTIFARDQNGNETSCTINVTVQDNIPPTAICQDITVSLENTGMVTIPGSSVNNNSTDNCTASLSYSLSTSTFDCTNLGANSVVLTVTDIGLSTSTCNANVTVQDNMMPVITLINTSSITIPPCIQYVDAGATAADNCGDRTAFIITVNPLSGIPPYSPGTYMITYNVMDAVGNSATEVTREVTVLPYSTISNGEYSSPSTWAGGCIPPNPIPSGVTVNINNVLENNVNTTLTNNGIIMSSEDFTNYGTYQGTGTFNGNFINIGSVKPGN